MNIKTLKDIDLKGKIVLYRADLNVPMSHGRVEDATRITRLLPTFNYLIKQKAKIVVLSHFGRPKGEFVRDLSLAPLADALSQALDGKQVKFAIDCIGETAKNAVSQLEEGDILLLENLRFHAGETANNAAFSDDLASLGDIYVNDTFSCSHRKHSSIVGIAKRLPSAAGFLLQEEIENLEKVLNNPKKPMAAIVGGSKVSTKLDLLNAVIKKVECLIIGGAMANTFLAAQGHDIGKSLHEPDLMDTAKQIIAQAEKSKCKIILPHDVVVSKDLKEKALCRVISLDKINKDEMILDIGPVTISDIAEELSGFKTLIWNGPMGAFECRPFDVGTISLARAVAALTTSKSLTSVAGGGDVVAALGLAGLAESFTYVSTAGGAFLQWLEGNELPGISALRA
ncbi:phosphoglycerate kinase [Rickettsiales bacterium]|nr:phosphoglycerate kinase [Rickettsiales bacterium]